MNEITSKNNTIKTVLIAILSILLVGCIGFIAYDKLIKKEESITEENNKTDDNEQENKQNSITGTYFNTTELYGASREILITLKNDNTFYIKNEEFDYEVEIEGKYMLVNNKIELTDIKPTGSTQSLNGIDALFHKSYDGFELDENRNVKKIVLEIKDNTLVFDNISFKK